MTNLRQFADNNVLEQLCTERSRGKCGNMARSLLCGMRYSRCASITARRMRRDNSKETALRPGNDVASTFALNTRNFFIRTGNISAEARIDGTVRGDLHLRTVVVGKNGAVAGSIYAEEAFIYGSVEGNIYARSISMCSSSTVRGMIVQRKLAIEPGANFRGSCISSVKGMEKYLQSKKTVTQPHSISSGPI